MSGIYAAVKALESVYEHLATDGCTSGHLDELVSLDRFQRLVGYEEKLGLQERYSQSQGEKLVVRVPGTLRAVHEDVP